MQPFGIHFIPDDHIIHSTDHSFIFVNIRPFLKHHILVSPKRIVDRVFDLSEIETKDLFMCVRLCTQALKFQCDGFTINIQDGKDAGQKVFHVHVHVVPRIKNDLKENDEIYKNLDRERIERSYEEMKEETIFLRAIFRNSEDYI